MRPLLLTLAVLVMVSVSMTILGVATGVMQPRGPKWRNITTPTGTAIFVDPPFTPQEEWLQIGVGVSWLVTSGAAVGLAVWWVVNRQRTRTEDAR